MNNLLLEPLSFTIENWLTDKKVTLESQPLFSLSLPLIPVILVNNSTQANLSFIDGERKEGVDKLADLNPSDFFSNSLKINFFRSLDRAEKNSLVFLRQLTQSNQLYEENDDVDDGTSELCEELRLVTHRAALKANDLLDWSSLGKVFDPWVSDPTVFLPNPIEAQSLKGLGITVEIPPSPISEITPPFVFQTSSEGIPTNFAEDDYILFSGFIPGGFPAIGNPGPLSIIFDRPVKAAGTQLAVDDTFNFTIFVEAFDSEDDSLGLFAVPGTASAEVDNSAQFVGLVSEEANIKKLVYGYSTTPFPEFNPSLEQRAFGINQLSIFAPDLLWESQELFIHDNETSLASSDFNSVEANTGQNAFEKYIDNYSSPGSLVNAPQDQPWNLELTNISNSSDYTHLSRL